MTGEFPPNFVDHINHDRDDNRWVNLRHATKSDNCRNTKMNSRNTSGVTGVYRSNKDGRWEASIKANGQKIFIGRFINLDDAARARKDAEIKHGFHPNHGK